MKPKKILLVEDHVDSLESLKFCLEINLKPEKISGAQSGEEAIKLLEKERFDLVITDMRLLHELTGVDVAKIAKKKGCLVIGTSISNRPDNLIVDAFIYKPFTAQEILRKIENL